jgi:hypothetical protein
MDLRWDEVARVERFAMKGLRDKIYVLNVLCYSLTSLRALRNLCERCVFVFLI